MGEFFDKNVPQMAHKNVLIVLTDGFDGALPSLESEIDAILAKNSGSVETKMIAIGTAGIMNNLPVLQMIATSEDAVFDLTDYSTIGDQDLLEHLCVLTGYSYND